MGAERMGLENELRAVLLIEDLCGAWTFLSVLYVLIRNEEEKETH